MCDDHSRGPDVRCTVADLLEELKTRAPNKGVHVAIDKAGRSYLIIEDCFIPRYIQVGGPPPPVPKAFKLDKIILPIVRKPFPKISISALLGEPEMRGKED